MPQIPISSDRVILELFKQVVDVVVIDLDVRDEHAVIVIFIHVDTTKFTNTRPVAAQNMHGEWGQLPLKAETKLESKSKLDTKRVITDVLFPANLLASSKEREWWWAVTQTGAQQQGWRACEACWQCEAWCLCAVSPASPPNQTVHRSRSSCLAWIPAICTKNHTCVRAIFWQTQHRTRQNVKDNFFSILNNCTHH